MSESSESERISEEPTAASPVSLAPLRREALLPTERARGLGTVAIVCTMAGVASGLALATTLMAMQVADSMSTTRGGCPYYQQADIHGPDAAYLGIAYGMKEGVATVLAVNPGTPAARIGLQRGDHVLAIEGTPIHSMDEMRSLIYDWHPGMTTSLEIERDGRVATVHPTLTTWPTRTPR